MAAVTGDSVKACMENLTETQGLNFSGLDPAEMYKMDHKRRGLALIFNQKSFHEDLNLGIRHGTNVDCDNLKQRLTELHFGVEIYNDNRKEEVLRKIREASAADHSDADCFLLAFMSHGEDGHVYASDGEISIQEITEPFKGDRCSSLAGKPKIFILQACRGEKYDDPVTPCAIGSEPGEDEVMMDACALQTIPAGADFIMCYSVAEGYFSFRNSLFGSWFIQDLCAVLQKYGGTHEFTDLLTLVNRKVSIRSVEKCRTTSAIGKKQAPCFASMLTKQLYFWPKK